MTAERTRSRLLRSPLPRGTAVALATRATRTLLGRGYLAGRTVSVLEFPKSGGTWLAKLIATTLEWPFLDDTAAIPGNNCVLRGHAVPTPATPDLVYLVRDPRDVYVSLFHHRIHHLATNPHYREAWASAGNPDLDPDRIREQLPKLIGFESTFAGHRGSGTPVDWAGHIRAWESSAPGRGRRVLVRYEELRADAPTTLRRIYAELFDGELPADLAASVVGAHDLSARRALTAHPPVGRSFARSGTTGGWPASVNREAGQLLERLAGPEMRRLGYTSDDRWWHALDD